MKVEASLVMLFLRIGGTKNFTQSYLINRIMIFYLINFFMGKLANNKTNFIFKYTHTMTSTKPLKLEQQKRKKVVDYSYEKFIK